MLQDQFENYLQTHLPKVTSDTITKPYIDIYNEALQKMLFANGKRFRPMLFLWIVDYYAKDLIDDSLIVALAIELLHTYSLIHDDLPCMDNATHRRGVTTLHTTYNEYTAVLVGDAFNTEAFYQITQAPLVDSVKIALIKVLSECGGQSAMVLGQYIDLASQNESLSFDELQYLHLNKTAKLIAGSLKMGGIVANLDKSTLDKLFALGLEIGVLFQIQDDILDVTSTVQQAGKDINQDKDKNSFVKVLGLDNAKQEANKRIVSIKELLSTFDMQFNDYILDKLSMYLYRHQA